MYCTYGIGVGNITLRRNRSADKTLPTILTVELRCQPAADFFFACTRNSAGPSARCHDMAFVRFPAPNLCSPVSAPAMSPYCVVFIDILSIFGQLCSYLYHPCGRLVSLASGIIFFFLKSCIIIRPARSLSQMDFCNHAQYNPVGFQVGCSNHRLTHAAVQNSKPVCPTHPHPMHGPDGAIPERMG